MKRFLITCLSALCLGGAIAQTEIREYRPGVTTEGITYFLPQTKLQIIITAKRTVKTPGEFANYAERFLRLNNAIQTKEEVWELQSIELATYGEADASQAYTIAHNLKTTAPLVRLAPDGRLLSINCEPPEIEELEEASVRKIVTTTIDSDKYKSQEILAAGSTQKMAELCAAEIYDIRENRSLLSKGQADFMPKDGEQLRLMLESLNEQEEGLMQLFRGSSESEMHTFIVDYKPEAKDTKGEILFRFSKHLGLVDNDDLAGMPYYIDVTDMKTLPAPVEATPEPSILGLKKQPKEVLDLRYRLPGTAQIKIYDYQNILTQIEIPLAQFGRIEHLGGDLFNRKLQTSVILSPTTGALMKIDMIEIPKK